MAKVGRPSDYTPEVLDVYEEYISEAIPQNMKIPTIEGLALKLGTYKTTLYRWAKANPKFRYALSELKKKQKEYLTEIGIFGGKEINSNIVALMLKVNHKMIETSRQEVTGKGGKGLKVISILGGSSTKDVSSDDSNQEDTEA